MVVGGDNKTTTGTQISVYCGGINITTYTLSGSGDNNGDGEDFALIILAYIVARWKFMKA